MDNVSVEPRLMSFHLLEEITSGFSKDRKIGAGSYGNVYKGEHMNGEVIAVKLLHNIPGLDDEEFEKEYHNLTSLQHKNIVRLVGYCNETRREFLPYNGKTVLAEMTQRALCFEYLQNGSLDRFLIDESSKNDWLTRYAIIKGICQGLRYLHEELDPPMYHLDLKPANILLDQNMVPKIADFGLARLFGGEQTKMTKSTIGTRGYIPPEYIDTAIISIKFDIFSLGVVIIKIMTGPTGYFRSAELSPQQFIELVHEDWNNKLQTTSAYALETYSKQVNRCIEIALSCVDADRHKRPSIGDIINKLNEMEAVIPFLGASLNVIGSSKNKASDFPSKHAKKQITSSVKKMVMVTGGDYTTSHRPGLDLVAVVDVSSSMVGEKMDQLKTAMLFVLRKLSPIDRLSIIRFANTAKKLCSLQQITEASRLKLEMLISKFVPARFTGTNIMEGLLTGLMVLANDKVTDGRCVAGIMLMSDGHQTVCDATEVTAGNVPVYTFGFGTDSDPLVLSAVATNSMGGTFSHVSDIGGGGLTMAFSQCLAGLLTVSVQELKLTVAAMGDKSAIVKVTAGSYPQTKDRNRSVTISFGNLYSREVRKVIVDLLLPEIEGNRSTKSLKVLEEATPAELQAEEARLHTAKAIKEARSMADCLMLRDAQDKLVEAENMLAEQPDLLLMTELQELRRLFKSPVSYEERGRPYALSSESSHDWQRFAARGDVEMMRLFATPHMDEYLVEAKKFRNN